MYSSLNPSFPINLPGAGNCTIKDVYSEMREEEVAPLAGAWIEIPWIVGFCLWTISRSPCENANRDSIG